MWQVSLSFSSPQEISVSAGISTPLYLVGLSSVVSEFVPMILSKSTPLISTPSRSITHPLKGPGLSCLGGNRSGAAAGEAGEAIEV
jgi:hypothetical protein